MTTWTKLYDQRPHGHAFFRDGRGRLVIADASGATPDRTDDGVLYVDTAAPLAVGDHGVRVPLMGGRHAPTTTATAAYLVAHHGMCVQIGRDGPILALPASPYAHRVTDQGKDGAA